MARVFFEAAYKPPRETNWLIGLMLLALIFAFGATGYLLPWDQWSYWTVNRGLELLAGLPVLGAFLTELLRGDVLVSGATLSRYFALHVIILPWILFALVLLHFTLLRKHGVAPPTTPLPEGARGVPFYPHHLLRSLMVSVLVVAVLISLAALFPRPVADMADPGRVPETAQSTWWLVDVGRGLVRVLGGWGLALFALLGLMLVVLPIVDREPERRLRHRPIVAAIGYAFFIGLVAAFAVGRFAPSGAQEVPPPVEAPVDAGGDGGGR
jgi:quinol-cytochrome oxidoreductase complex cytochrome b subunit